MLKRFTELPVRKRVGILGIILGLLAVFAGSPYNRSEIKINMKELSQIPVEEITNVSVKDLSEKIIKSQFDYRLVDLRNSEEFGKYNIPGSENIRVSEILSSDLSRNENIIIYSDNSVESAQAWFLLKSNGYKSVGLLKGGLNEWKNEILFPKCTCGDNPSSEQIHKHKKLSEVSKFFGGSMQTGKMYSDSPQMEMPDVKPPAEIILKKTTGKRKREGC